MSAIIYATFAFSAIALARHTDQDQNGNSKVTDISASIMEHTAGRWADRRGGRDHRRGRPLPPLKGITMDVNDELDLSGMSATRRVWTERLGAIGEVGRGVGIGLVGFFMVRAAIKYNAAEATGLDGALRRLATNTWGLVLVVVVGLGFVGLRALLRLHVHAASPPGALTTPATTTGSMPDPVWTTVGPGIERRCGLGR